MASKYWQDPEYQAKAKQVPARTKQEDRPTVPHHLDPLKGVLRREAKTN